MLLIVIGFALMYWSFKRVADKFGERWDFARSATSRVCLLVALFSVYAFALTPVSNTITRSMERRGGRLRSQRGKATGRRAQAALHLAEYRKMQPGALEEVIFFDHPSGWNRIIARWFGRPRMFRLQILLPTTRCTALPVSAKDLRRPGSPMLPTPESIERDRNLGRSTRARSRGG